MRKKTAACYCTFFVCLTSYAGIMRHDIEVQDYRDFAENLGKYTVGTQRIPVYKKNGELSGTLNFSMPDFGMVITGGYATLVSPSYLASARHNTGYQSAKFGNGAQYAANYKLINRNDSTISNVDFHLPRLSKVVTDAAPVNSVNKTEIRKGNVSRYSTYVRLGAGTQSQVNDTQTKEVTLTGAYKWKSGGTINAAAINFSPGTLRFQDYGPDSALTSPLSIGIMAGDSGSPIMVYDEVDKEWKVAGVLHALISKNGIYQTIGGFEYIPDNYIATILTANTSPDVNNTAADSVLQWSSTSISQGESSWSWQGLADKYKNIAPSAASDKELDATKDLRFNGEGGQIVLTDSVNMGAGKLQFSNNYTLKSADGVNASWAGGGIEVDEGKNVLWQVNGLADDALHKIGAGTLHINAAGINRGSLNTGDGTVILDQQTDADGQKQAFSSVTLVSGRPTVVLNDAQQVATGSIFFGYRGGMLDLNGTNLSFKKINHTDSGATLVNHNTTTAATLTLSGYSSADVPFKKFSGSNPKGVVGSIYVYANPHTKDTEYFQLLKSSYWYFPTDKSSTSTWAYLGTDANAAVDYRLAQLNQLVFRGFLGDSNSSKEQGVLNVNIDTSGSAALTALTGGMNLKGDLNVSQGTVLLSGQPVPHAGGVVFNDDWATTIFSANQISVSKDSTLQVGEYAQVQADIVAKDSSHVMLGYNSSASDAEKIWRCYAVINTTATTCSQPVRSAFALTALAASNVSGDITLGENASLYLGKVNYQGVISTAATSSITMDSGAFWQPNGSNRVSTLKALSGSGISLLAAEGTTWSPTLFNVESLDANGLNIRLAASPATEQGDKVTIEKSATGSSNILDISVLTNSSKPVMLLNDIVLLDAPGGTAHDYFTVPSIARGFSLYTPDYQVVDKDNRVLWVLAHNVEPEPEPKPEPKPGPEKPTEPETPTKPSKPAISDEVSEPETPVDPTDGKPSIWFTIEDNKPLIHDTRALLASRQYVFSEAVSQLHGRASLLRISPEKNGEWVSIEQNKGSFRGFDVTQQSLNLGWDSVQKQQMFGVSAGYTTGKTKGNGQETHHLASIGANYSWSSPVGWFVDAATRYMRLSQDLTFNPELGVHHGKANSHILAGSVKSGYQFTDDRSSLFISPYVGLSGGYLSGYGLKGEIAQVSLSSSTPYLATTGLEVKKRGLCRSNPDVMVTAGLEYQYSPGKAGSSLTLSDSQSRRKFSAWSDNRYRAHVGIEGAIADKWSVDVKARTSFGGTFRTDYSGTAGVNYHF